MDSQDQDQKPHRRRRHRTRRFASNGARLRQEQSLLMLARVLAQIADELRRIARGE